MADLETEPLLRKSTRLQHDDYDYQREQQLQKAHVEQFPYVGTGLDTATIGRHISWTSAYILVISRVIGSGIFAMPGTIFQNVGSIGLALTLWMAGAGISSIALSIDIEYGCMLPRSGGLKVYLEYTYLKPRFLASTMVAIYAILLGFTASNCIIFSKYFIFATGIELTDLNTKAIGVGLLTIVTIVHACFYRMGIWVQNAIGMLKMGLIVFMIATGLFVLLFPSTSKTASTFAKASGDWEYLWGGSHWSLGTIAPAVLKVSYSYAGLDNVHYILNEVKNPVWAVRAVGPAALITACLMYVLINIAYFAVVPLEEIKQSQELVAALFFERVFGTSFGNVFLPLAIALSSAGNVMVSVFALSRLKQEIARRGFLPFEELLASSRPFGAPMGGLIVHWIPSFLVIVLPSSATVYAFAAEVEGYAGQFMALAVAFGLLILRIREPNLTRPFKAWIPAIWLRTALCFTLIAAPLFPRGQGSMLAHGAYALVGSAVIAFGLLYWFIWTIVVPRYREYRLEDEAHVLPDGTTITKLIKQWK